MSLEQERAITSRYVDRVTCLYRVVRELIEEVCAAVGGVFFMPFRCPMRDKGLEQLDNRTLTDIGYKRVRH